MFCATRILPYPLSWFSVILERFGNLVTRIQAQKKGDALTIGFCPTNFPAGETPIVNPFPK